MVRQTRRGAPGGRAAANTQGGAAMLAALSAVGLLAAAVMVRAARSL